MGNAVNEEMLDPETKRLLEMAKNRKRQDLVVETVAEGTEIAKDDWAKKVICTLAKTGRFQIKFKLAPGESCPLTRAEFNRLIRGLNVEYRSYTKLNSKLMRTNRRKQTEGSSVTV